MADSGDQKKRSDASWYTARLVSLPTRAQLGAAHDSAPSADRKIVIVALHPADSVDVVLGWGECSALNAPTYTQEWAQGAFDQLSSGVPIDRQTSPMAAAALEMAHLDADLRRASSSLAERLGTAEMSAPAGGVVGLAPIPTMIEQVHELVAAGCQRVKCKIEPGRIVEPIRAVLAAFPKLEIHVDANGTLGTDDLVLLGALRDLGVRAVEQPFRVGEHGLAARLVADTDLAVIADEAVNTVDDVWALARDAAATGVSIKPPRVGGLRSALQIVDAAEQAGMHCTIGGMLETGLGRHQLAALAPLAPFTITGDLTPAGRWLAVDPFPDIEIVDGSIAAPDTIGIAGDPDLDLLEAHTIARWTGEISSDGFATR